MKWYPDRWIKDPKLALEAKKRFQRVQEAYSGALREQIKLMYLCFFFYISENASC